MTPILFAAALAACDSPGWTKLESTDVPVYCNTVIADDGSYSYAAYLPVNKTLNYARWVYGVDPPNSRTPRQVTTNFTMLRINESSYQIITNDCTSLACSFQNTA